MVEGVPMFVARDVALALGYPTGSVTNALNRHCKGMSKQHIHTAGGTQTVTIIPERDVYRLVMN